MSRHANVDPAGHTLVELRQYTLRPGQRQTLIELFDSRFIEAQEAAGMRVIGQFRDIDRPDRFVWLRSFPDMPARAAALAAFYDGPVWREHRDTANGTMMDSDNVLLLRPIAGAGFAPASPRPPVGATTCPAGLVTATVYHRADPADPTFGEFLHRRLLPAARDAGAHVLACLETEPAENTFPRLPVRTDSTVFVWLARFGSTAEHRRYTGRLANSRRWTRDVSPELTRHLASAPEHLRLAPTARSALR